MHYTKNWLNYAIYDQFLGVVSLVDLSALGYNFLLCHVLVTLVLVNQTLLSPSKFRCLKHALKLQEVFLWKESGHLK